MISRYWRGLAKPAFADAYIEHLKTDTFPQLASIAGFIDASILRRNEETGVEFLIITRWDSIGAIHQFAGQAADIAVVPPKIQEMMTEYDHKVRHYEVIK